MRPRGRRPRSARRQPSERIGRRKDGAERAVSGSPHRATPRRRAPLSALRCDLAARAKTSPSSGVVGEGRGPAGSIHSTASTSSLRRGSPRVQRATNEAMTKCVRIRFPSWKIASTCRLKAMISASIPTSSISSRASAAASVSPTSTPPPGRLKWPSSGARARRMMSARPSAKHRRRHREDRARGKQPIVHGCS